MLIRLSGGLGNQLFQYAVGEWLRMALGEKVTYETFSYFRDKKRKLQLNEFQINEIGKTRTFYSFFYYFLARIARGMQDTKKWDEEFGILRDELAMEITSNSIKGKRYLVGYWQNTANIEQIKKELQMQFRCKETFEKSEKLIREFANVQSVAVHVRRGDYLQGANKEVYVGCSLEYYETAMQHVRERISKPMFLIFSNDIEWCKANLKGDDICFIDEKYSDGDINDFELMRVCKHFIIANSTFSWWASWLADDVDKIVIAPSK